MDKETLVPIEPKVVLPEVTLVGQDGNAFAIMGACKRAARNVYSQEEWENIQAQMMSGDYDNLLQIAMKYFDVY